MTGKYYSFLSDKVENRLRPYKCGCGVYAIRPISKGELITLWSGRIVRRDELDPRMPNFTQRMLQVDEDFFLETPEQLEPSDGFNHSCDPNAGMTGQIGLAAMRDIAKGEEICFDYAMSDGSNYDEFVCTCVAANCRGRITGKDWSIPELLERYGGYFSPYLQRRIERLKNKMSRP